MARYVMNVLTQYMGTLNGVLQARGRPVWQRGRNPPPARGASPPWPAALGVA